MRIMMAQLNPVVGDIEGNSDRVKSIFVESYPEKPDLIVFPELYLVGYPPKDLLEQKWFIKRVEAAIDELVQVSAQHPATGILLGAPLPTGKNSGNGLYNSALLIYQGQILLNQPKSLLPTYDVFDEARHFDPAPEIKTVAFKDENLGITICEDAWNDPDFWPLCKIYDFDPIAELARQGATLFINISASPFHVGKDELRFRLMGKHAKKYQRPFFFVNQIGGNDELIFDGGSMCFDNKGDLIFSAPFFKEQLQLVDTNSCNSSVSFKSQNTIELVYQALVLGTKDYLRKCGFNQAVVGLSGGIDSALTCCIASDALGPENVLGITMPSKFSSEGSISDSKQLSLNLGIKFEEIPISDIFNAYLNTLCSQFAGKEVDVTEENIQARIRGNILMAFSNKFGYLALSTGNKSELAVGYCTLYGDMSGGLSVISDVPKTMVYELAAYVNREKEIIPEAIIKKAPSAELRPDQYDQDTLPPYPVLDQILHYYIEEGYSILELIDLNYDPQTVKWVIRKVDQNEYKRKQAAPGLKVTSKAFGAGRRIPVAKKL